MNVKSTSLHSGTAERQGANVETEKAIWALCTKPVYNELGGGGVLPGLCSLQTTHAIRASR